MNRMSDVFDLPLQAVFTGKCFHLKTNLTDAAELEAECPSNAWAAERAINNVDALADMLGESLLQIAYLQNKFGETGSGNSVLHRGQATLDAYRGAK